MTPISIDVELRRAITLSVARVDVPAVCTVGISTEPEITQNAAERLRGLPVRDIEQLAKDIILGQFRLAIAQMAAEEIDLARDRFLEALSCNIEAEIRKIGLCLINLNITDVTIRD